MLRIGRCRRRSPSSRCSSLSSSFTAVLPSSSSSSTGVTRFSAFFRCCLLSPSPGSSSLLSSVRRHALLPFIADCRRLPLLSHCALSSSSTGALFVIDVFLRLSLRFVGAVFFHCCVVVFSTPPRCATRHRRSPSSRCSPAASSIEDADCCPGLERARQGRGQRRTKRSEAWHEAW